MEGKSQLNLPIFASSIISPSLGLLNHPLYSIDQNLRTLELLTPSSRPGIVV